MRGAETHCFSELWYQPRLFEWAGKSFPHSTAGLVPRLAHGDLLIIDGQCQDEFVHCTEPGQEHERINVTFRWIDQHVAPCPSAEVRVTVLFDQRVRRVHPFCFRREWGVVHVGISGCSKGASLM